MSHESGAHTPNESIDRLTYLRAEVMAPIEEPDDIADLGDDDTPALNLTAPR
jgi:hypothetical protein